jgi:hypothetical protein
LKIVAYDRLVGQIREMASLGATLAEAKQSYSMIERRGLQLLRFARAIRRFDIPEAMRSLDLSGQPPRRAKERVKARDEAGLILEFSFGWFPLVGDIFTAVEALNEPLKRVRVTGSASAKGSVLAANWPPTMWDAAPRWDYDLLKVKYGASVFVSNPHVGLLTQLGLVNPATIVWETIPFSFVVDWFVNVEQFLAQGTDFWGLTLQDAYTTKFAKGKCLRQWGSGYSGSYSLFDVARVSRVLGIDKPGIGLRQAKAWGWRRGLNAISLLALHLKSI